MTQSQCCRLVPIVVVVPLVVATLQLVVFVAAVLVVVVAPPLVFICRNFTIFSLTCAKWPISRAKQAGKMGKTTHKVKGKCGKIETKPAGICRDMACPYGGHIWAA